MARFGMAVVGLLVAACTASPVPQGSGATPTPTSLPSLDVLTYRGDAARTGRMPGPAPSGAPIAAWTYQAAAAIESSPVVVGDNAIIASKDGVIHALDLVTGVQRWSRDLGSPLGSATPLVAAGLLLIGDTAGVVHSLEVTSGRPRWMVKLDGPIGGSGVVVEDGYLTATEAGTAYRLALATGVEAWHHALSGGVSRSLATDGESVFLGTSGGGLTALATSDGGLRWQVKIATAGEGGTPTVADGQVFDATGLDGHDPSAMGIAALDARTGSVLWHRASPSGRQPYTPAVAGDRAFVVAEDGSVVALDVMTGDEVWSHTLASPAEAVPVVTGGLLVVATNGGTIDALEASTGTLRWRAGIAGVPYGPVVTHGLVLVGTGTGSVFAVGTYVP